jgi:hypothetical protein
MITIKLPDGDEYEITNTEEAADLERELDALGMSDALRGNHPIRVQLEVNEGNYERVARALDHLRNAGNAGPETHAVREAVLARLKISPLTYALRSWEFDGEDLTFWSYTGQYSEADRIVHRGEVLRVVKVAQQATPARDGVLIVESWSQRRN